ncbi:MAG: DivIVA domain-containing protein [candidate division WOR-3 bacterium]
MAITPLEVRKKSFSSQLRGYAPREVRTFLNLVANELEELRKERAALAEKVDQLTARVENYQKTEQLLRDTLVTAQKATAELKAATEAECQAIIDRAKLEAEKLHADLRELRSQRDMLLDQIRGIANTYLAMVDRLSKEMKEDAQGKDSGKRSGD